MKPKIRTLETKALETISEELSKAATKMEQQDFKGAEKHYLKIWQLLPEPKYSWDFSEAALLALAEFYRDTQKYEEARAWIGRLFDNCEVLPFESRPFLVAGTIEFEAGALEEARKHFEKALAVGKERAFAGANSKYLNFLKQKKR